MKYKRNYKKTYQTENKNHPKLKKSIKIKVLISLFLCVYFFNYFFNIGSFFEKTNLLNYPQVKKVVSFCKDAKNYIVNKTSYLDKIGQVGSDFCYRYLGGDKKLSVKAEDKKTKENKVIKKDALIPTVEPTQNEFSPIMPVKADISSPYGKRIHPIDKKESFHTGVDFKVDKNTEILCISDGVVIKSEYTNINGNYIIIDHQNGYKSAYAHLEKSFLKVGDYAKKGKVIALSGQSGNVTGPHLHFEIKYNDKPIDPFLVIK